MTNTSQPVAPAWVPRFLDALRAGKGPTQAARDAGVEGSTPYKWRVRDAAFRAEWQAIKGADGRKHPGNPRTAREVSRIDRFIAELVESSNVAAAATAADMTTSQVYRLRRTDPAFARRWFAALAEGYDNLEMELLAHLRAGDNSEVQKTKFDAATAFRCLAAHRESVAREKGRRGLEDEVETIASINAKIDRLRRNAKASDKAVREARKVTRARRIDGADGSSSSVSGRTDNDQ